MEYNDKLIHQILLKYEGIVDVDLSSYPEELIINYEIFLYEHNFLSGLNFGGSMDKIILDRESLQITSKGIDKANEIHRRMYNVTKAKTHSPSSTIESSSKDIKEENKQLNMLSQGTSYYERAEKLIELGKIIQLTDELEFDFSAYTSWSVQTRMFLNKTGFLLDDPLYEDFLDVTINTPFHTLNVGIGLLEATKVELEFGEQSGIQDTSPKTSSIPTTRENDKPTVKVNIPELVKLLSENMFNLEELETLRINVGIQEEFQTKTKTSQAREIVTYMQRRNQLSKLIKEAFTMNNGWIDEFIQNCIE